MLNMSPSVADLESQWLAQLRSMREAIAELNLDQKHGQVQAYGHDMVVDDEITGSSGSGSEDFWDVWGDNEDTEETEESSDLIDGHEEGDPQRDSQHTPHTRAWLHEKCLALVTGDSGLEPTLLEEQLLALLASDMQGGTLESKR